MIGFIVTYLVLYGVAILLLVFTGFFLQVRKEDGYQSSERFDLNTVSVIIPFRNEENRLKDLIESIKKASKLPLEIIFVNDHSVDKGRDVLENELGTFPIQIIDTPEGLEGKKNAIRLGMKNAKGKYLLTLDADVYFDVEFFSKIELLDVADLYVRPAIMKANSFLEFLYEIDLALVNAVNVGVAGWIRPIMASGANLMYNAEVFKSIDSFENHHQVASGDDMYTLKDFRENNKCLRIVTSVDHCIYTETPQSFREFLNQRLRWLGKTNDLKDNLSNSLAAFHAMFTLVFFSLILLSIYEVDYLSLLVLLSVKTIIDLFVFFPYMKRINRLKTWMFIPLYELLFPFYTLMILFGLLFFTPKWKGRKVKHK